MIFNVLPESLIIALFHEWLDLSNLALLDSSCTSKKLRNVFLSYLQAHPYQASHRCSFNNPLLYKTTPEDDNITMIAHFAVDCHDIDIWDTLQWVEKRQLTVSNVSLDVEAKTFIDYHLTRFNYPYYSFVSTVHLYMCKEHLTDADLKTYCRIPFICSFFPCMKALEIWASIDADLLTQIKDYLMPNQLQLKIRNITRGLDVTNVQQFLLGRLKNDIISFPCETNEALDVMTKSCPNVTELDYFHADVSKEQFLSAAASFHKLQLLDLTHPSLGTSLPLHEIDMMNLVSHLPNLTTCSALDQPFRLALHLIDSCPLLTSISTHPISWKSMWNEHTNSKESFLVINTHSDSTLEQDIHHFLIKIPVVTRIKSHIIDANAAEFFVSLMRQCLASVDTIFVYYKTLIVDKTFVSTIFKACPNLVNLDINNGVCSDVDYHVCMMNCDDSMELTLALGMYAKALSCLKFRNVSILDTTDMIYLLSHLPNILHFVLCNMTNVRGTSALFSALHGRVWESLELFNVSISLGDLHSAVAAGQLRAKLIKYISQHKGKIIDVQLGYGKQIITAEHVKDKMEEMVARFGESCLLNAGEIDQDDEDEGDVFEEEDDDNDDDELDEDELNDLAEEEELFWVPVGDDSNEVNDIVDDEERDDEDAEDIDDEDDEYEDGDDHDLDPAMLLHFMNIISVPLILRTRMAQIAPTPSGWRGW